jgi:hypothetical protein
MNRCISVATAEVLVTAGEAHFDSLDVPRM